MPEAETIRALGRVGAHGGAVALLAVAAAAGACSDGPTAPGGVVSVERVGSGHAPAISGETVVWERFSGGPLLVEDLATGRQRELARGSDSSRVAGPAVSGRRAVWRMTFSSGSGFPPSPIVLTDLDRRDTTLVSDPEPHDASPDVSGRHVVWQRQGPEGPDVLALDLETGETIPVSTDDAAASEPAVDGGRVVYTRTAVDADGELSSDIMLRDLSSGETRRLNPNEGRLQGNPDISGDVVVWIDNTDGTSDVVYRDLATGEFVNVTRNRGHASFPSVSGSLVAWSDARNVEPGQEGLEENLDVFAFDLETGREFPITTAPGRQSFPAVSGDRVVWEDWSGPTGVLVAEVDR